LIEKGQAEVAEAAPRGRARLAAALGSDGNAVGLLRLRPPAGAQVKLAEVAVTLLHRLAVLLEGRGGEGARHLLPRGRGPLESRQGAIRLLVQEVDETQLLAAPVLAAPGQAEQVSLVPGPLAHERFPHAARAFAGL